MNKLVLMSFVAFLSLSGIGSAFGQESAQYLMQTLRTSEGCPVSHFYSSKFYVPVTVKIFHDQTPDFLVHTNSTTVGAQINPDGSTGNVYLETVPNSTASFTIDIYAKYFDGLEHPIVVEYWSQNQPMFTEPLSTVGSKFCHEILIETSQAPVTPDLGNAVRQVTESLLGKLVSVVGQNSITFYYSIVFNVIFDVVIILLIVAFWIRSGREDSGRMAADQKIDSLIVKQGKTSMLFSSNIKFFTLELQRMMNEIRNIKDRQSALQSSFLDELEIHVKSWILEILKMNKVEVEETKKDEINSVPAGGGGVDLGPLHVETKEVQRGTGGQPQTPIFTAEATVVKEEPTLRIPEEIPDNSLTRQVIETIKNPKSLFQKEQKVRTQEEFYDEWKKESDEDKISKRYQVVLEIYQKQTESRKDYDKNVENELYALHRLLMERNT